MDKLSIYRITGDNHCYTDKELIDHAVCLVKEVNDNNLFMRAKFLLGTACEIHLNDKLIYSRRSELENITPELIDVIKKLKQDGWTRKI